MNLVEVPNDGWTVSEDLFGGNVVADWANLDNFTNAIEDLNVTTLRYPGGSQTERYFDIDNPNSPIAVHNETGEVKEYIPLSDFMSYAEENGHPISIVIPTKTQLSDETDEMGHRLPEINEDSLRTFVRDVANGEYGNAKISAFEIGNEYWHSGDMDSVEYGRLASAMSKIINSELEALESSRPQVAEIEIAVQMGYNHGTSIMDEDYGDMSPEDALLSINEDYGLDLDENALYRSGGVNWTYINNQIIMQHFDDPEDLEAIDGVIAHVYTLGEENELTRYFGLDNLADTWLEEYPELSIHVTEWNQKGVTQSLDGDEDYGLFQAEEMMNIVEEFIRVGVDHAQVWPLIQNVDNSLNVGYTYGETNVPGALFSMLAENLPGKQMLDFAPDSTRDTEADFGDVVVRGFAGQDELLLYVNSDSREEVVDTDLDVSGLIQGFETLELTILGVGDDALPGSNQSGAVLEVIDPETAFVDGFIDVPLDPGEILQVKFTGVVPTEALSQFFSEESDPEVILQDEQSEEEITVEDILELATDYIPDDTLDEKVQDEELSDDGDGFAGLEFALMLAPVLAILAAFGGG